MGSLGAYADRNYWHKIASWLECRINLPIRAVDCGFQTNSNVLNGEMIDDVIDYLPSTTNEIQHTFFGRQLNFLLLIAQDLRSQELCHDGS